MLPHGIYMILLNIISRVQQHYGGRYKFTSRILSLIEPTVMEFVVHYVLVKHPREYSDFKYSDKINNFIRTELSRYVSNTVPSNRGSLYRLDPEESSIIPTYRLTLKEVRYKTIVELVKERLLPGYMNSKMDEGIYSIDMFPGLYYMTAIVRGRGP